MLQAFSGLKSVVSLKWRGTESFVFYLHYRVTFLILVFCLILISGQHFINDKIHCLSKKTDEISEDFMNNYCWSASTHSVPSAYSKKVGVQVPHPGVEGSEEERMYTHRNYYQYVHIVLFLQIVLTYVPHAIWKVMEPDFIESLPEAINKVELSKSKEKSNEILSAAAIFIEERWNSLKFLPFKYFSCEILSTLIVFLQIYFLNVFFNGKFFNLGLWLEAYYNSEILSDPLELFPLVTICFFQRYGASGSLDIVDSLCVLPINAINGKVFLFIWFWLTFLFTLSLCNLVHFGACLLAPNCRMWPLKIRSYFEEGPFQRERRNREFGEKYEKLLKKGNVGDWFVLSALKANIEEMSFSRLVHEINMDRKSETIKEKTDESQSETNNETEKV